LVFPFRKIKMFGLLSHFVFPLRLAHSCWLSYAFVHENDDRKLVTFEIPKQVRNGTLCFVMLNLVLNLIQYRLSISFNASVLVNKYLTFVKLYHIIRTCSG